MMTVSPQQNKRFIKLIFIFFTLLVFASCASTPPQQALAQLIDHSERMFWEIKGTDAKGNPSTVYIQGTIHLGDENIFPLAETVITAFNESSKLVGEISSDDWKQFLPNLQQRVIAAFSIGADKQQDFRLRLTKEENTQLNMLLGNQTTQSLAFFKPWVITVMLTEKMFKDSNLKQEYGLDVAFITEALNQNRAFEGLEPISTQLDLLAYGTYDEQIIMLKDQLESLRNPSEYLADLDELYQAYLSNNKQLFAKVFDKQLKKSIEKTPDVANYTKKIFTERNTLWADKINSYLKEGGTTFIFCGAGHLVGKDSVFEIMKAKKMLSIQK